MSCRLQTSTRCLGSKLPNNHESTCILYASRCSKTCHATCHLHLGNILDNLMLPWSWSYEFMNVLFCFFKWDPTKTSGNNTRQTRSDDGSTSSFCMFKVTSIRYNALYMFTHMLQNLENYHIYVKYLMLIDCEKCYSSAFSVFNLWLHNQAKLFSLHISWFFPSVNYPFVIWIIHIIVIKFFSFWMLLF